MESLRSRINALSFALRRRAFGRLRLRTGTPRVEENEAERRFYTLLLSEALGESQAEPAEVATVVDVGCRSWSYAPALAAFFPRAALVGVEVDGGRRFLDLHRRMDVAEAQAARLRHAGRDVTCVFEDFRALAPGALKGERGSRLAVTFFFPFVSADPCLQWGLPEEFADYRELLGHAAELALARGARLVVVGAHQGEWEAQIARENYLAAGFEVREVIVPAARYAGLWPSPWDTHLFIAQRAAGCFQ